MHGHAQVFIPDQIERDWLNELIPGVVDAGGVMDTLHPGIANVNLCIFDLQSDNIPLSLELHGLRYLDSLRAFSFVKNYDWEQDSLMLIGVPPLLDRISIQIGAGHIVLPALPARMTELFINDEENAWAAGPVSIHIDQLPDTLLQWRSRGASALNWNGTGYFQYFELNPNGASDQSLHVPPLSTHSVGIVDGVISAEAIYDLSEVTAASVSGSGLTLSGTLLWPASVEEITLFNCGVSGTLGPLPSTLNSLAIDSYLDFCLPPLPDGITYMQFSSAVNCIPNWPAALITCLCPFGEDPNTATYCSVLNSTCPGAYPGIAGRVFRDLDTDGQFDTGEPGLPQASVTLQPNGNVVGCQSDGTWEIGVLPGVYGITTASNYPYIQGITPAQHTADVPDMGDADTGNDFAATLIPGINDLRAFLTASVARPGFDNRLFLSCNNYGTEPVNTTLTLEFDPAQSWLGSSIAPTSLTAHTASWDLGTMAIGTTTNLSVDLHTDASVPLGTPITHVLTASPVTTDETPLDNVYAFTDSVVGSYDPNDKLLTPAVLPPTQVAAGATPIQYTIRFQNTGTYMAERVVIVDTLSEDLQWNSMRFVASSHAHHWYITDGVLHVVHEGINLPDSTSDEPGSHGFFTFNMLPATELQDGDQIVNIAHIVFDFNTPIITPPAVFRVDVLAGVHEHAATGPHVIPNPATDRVRIQGLTGRTTYRMCDISGRIVLQGQLDGAGTIHVGALPAGLYIVGTTSTEGVGTVRFVKE